MRSTVQNKSQQATAHLQPVPIAPLHSVRNPVVAEVEVVENTPQLERAGAKGSDPVGADFQPPPPVLARKLPVLCWLQLQERDSKQPTFSWLGRPCRSNSCRRRVAKCQVGASSKQQTMSRPLPTSKLLANKLTPLQKHGNYRLACSVFSDSNTLRNMFCEDCA